MGRPALLSVFAPEETMLLEVGKGGKAARVVPKLSGSAEPRSCQATNSNMSMCDGHECDGMGLALGVRQRWDPLRSPRVLRLCLFLMGRERWVLCSLFAALSEASNREWDWKR